MSIHLKVIKGPHEGKEFQFREHDSFIVGRGQQAHFRLPHDDRYFSRVHFLLEVNPPRCRLVDLGSRNGTKVNGQRVKSAELSHEDVITAGRTEIQVRISTGSTAVPSSEGTVIMPAGPLEAIPPSLSEESAPAPEDCSGLELIPVPVGAELLQAVPDPRGLLPPDYLKRIPAHPQPIAGYHLVRELGRGGMGRVYLAIRNADRSIVAVKTILPGVVVNSRDQERFLREARILQQLIHPHIVAYRETGESDGLLYFAMEYVPGRGADALIKDLGQKFPIQRAVKIILHLLTALRYAHAEGFVHRDIKPANLLIEETLAGDVLKLADFGLARTYQASGLSGLTMTDDVGGTVGYMPPEQIANFRGVQPASDQYATAATLYHLLTGSLVHDFPQNEPGKMLFLILEGEPVPIRSRRPEIPAGLAAAIHRALSRNPKDRFPDIREFHTALLPYGTEASS